MNRIILIGNGFDLAHGLKTSYKDFIDWYWREWGKKLYQGKSKLEEDELCRFKLNDGVELAAWYLVWHYYYHRNPSSEPWDESKVVEIAKRDSKLCTFTIKSPLFKELYRSYETKGWVDIENQYYEYLCHSVLTHDEAKAANDDMDFIKSKLIEYLKFVQEDALKSLVVDIDDGLKNKFIDDVR